MSRINATPYFASPPAEYQQRYFADVMQSFAIYTQQMSNPGPLRSTELTLTRELVNVDYGQLSWNDGDSTLDLTMGGGVTQQVGLETFYHIKADAAISNGDVVMFTGSVGASGRLKGAPASAGLTNGFLIMGVATQDIAKNESGFVTYFGVVRGINTSAFSDGDILYYDPTVVGGLTNVEPSPAFARVIVAAVVRAGPSGSGSLFVRPVVVPSSTALGYPTKSVTTDYTVTPADYTILCDTTSGPLTVTLPVAGGSSNGHIYNVKKIDSTANAVTIAADGAETIDGNISISIAVQWTCLTVQSNGTDWFIT